jgi:hypothetical protein
MVTLFTEATGGMEFKVQVQERALEGLGREPGQTLWLSFDSAKAHIVRDR